MKKLTAVLITVGLLSTAVLGGCSNSNQNGGASGTVSGTGTVSEADTKLTFKKISQLSDTSKYPALMEYKSGEDAYVCVIDRNAPEKVTVPAEHDGLPVWAVIGEDADNTAVRELTVSEGVAVIEELFAAKNNSLTVLTLPDSIRAISHSFTECDALKEVTLKSNPKLIRQSFTGGGLEKLTLGDITGEIRESFCALPSLTELSFGKVDNPVMIDSFEKLSALRTVHFNGEVDLMNRLTEKEEYVNSFLFYQFGALQEITFLEKVARLPKSFCSSCEKLESVTFKKDVGQISESSFDDCDNLSSLTFGGKVGLIDSYSFTSGKFSSLTFEHEIGKINNCVFQSCDELSSVVFKGEVMETGRSFALCKKLESIRFEKNVGTLDSSFNKCKSLKKVTFEGDVDTIGSSFADCPELETVTFNGTLKHLNAGSFSHSDKVVLENLSGDVEYGSDEMAQRFDSGQQQYRGYYDKINRYSEKELKEWVLENVAGQTLDNSKQIKIGDAARYADILNGPLVTNSSCTICPYEEYGPAAAKDSEYYVDTIKELKKNYPNTVYTDAKALKVANGEAPLVIGVAESMGYIPVEYIDKEDAGHVENLYYEMMRVSLWNLETGELIAWYQHRDGEAPSEYNTKNRSDYAYHEKMLPGQDFYFFKGGYQYPEALLMETIFPDQA